MLIEDDDDKNDDHFFGEMKIRMDVHLSEMISGRRNVMVYGFFLSRNVSPDLASWRPQ